jgi:branched-chain amino acid aminotransferase
MPQNSLSAFPYAFFEGKITPIEKAKVSIMTNALQYGTGVFGGIRGYFNQDKQVLYLFRPEDHVRRMLQSLKILGVTTHYSIKELVDVIISLTKKNNPKQNVYFRPFCYASSLLLSPNLSRDKNFEFALYMLPLDDYLSTDKGLSVKVSSWRRVSDNAIPARGKITGAYVNSALARKEAADDGYDEAIMLTESGEVSEGSAENLFIVRKGQLITPGITEDVLEGVTRRTVKQLAIEMGLEVIERSIDRTELYVSDEAFFCGTGVQISWITSIDKRIIGNGKIGPVTLKLQKHFFEIVYGKLNEHQEWRLSV